MTNEDMSKLKIPYTNLPDSINVIYGWQRILMEKKPHNQKRIYNHYLDKTSGTMKNIQFKMEDIFGDVKAEESISPEQMKYLNNFFAYMM